MSNIFSRLIEKSRKRSPWVYRINAGSCNGCDIEVAPCFSPRYDGEQIGALLQGSPKHADILLISGPITLRTKDMVKDVYDQIPSPKAVIALGSCPATGNLFHDSPTIVGSAEAVIPVDLYVPGCPPRPQAILEAIQTAASLLEKGETRSQKEVTNG
ncbi:MAG: NADH-quinone oxidoreductase subunit NuoB [Leptolinea sp.]|jgi:Ni,Fe-hydrogenase III small subunit|nr:NADH-quinone oxidoreductase subunit NuoB [Leptolinea sp.]